MIEENANEENIIEKYQSHSNHCMENEEAKVKIPEQYCQKN